MKKAILIENINTKLLKDFVSEAVKEEFEKLKKELYIEREKDELLSREQTADLLKISLPTLLDWRKKGIVKPYKMGNRVYYKRAEIMETLEKSSPNWCRSKN